MVLPVRVEHLMQVPVAAGVGHQERHRRAVDFAFPVLVVVHVPGGHQGRTRPDAAIAVSMPCRHGGAAPVVAVQRQRMVVRGDDQRPIPGGGSALGFRNLTNYIARSPLGTGGFKSQPHP